MVVDGFDSEGIRLNIARDSVQRVSVVVLWADEGSDYRRDRPDSAPNTSRTFTFTPDMCITPVYDLTTW